MHTAPYFIFLFLSLYSHLTARENSRHLLKISSPRHQMFMLMWFFKLSPRRALFRILGAQLTDVGVGAFIAVASAGAVHATTNNDFVRGPLFRKRCHPIVDLV